MKLVLDSSAFFHGSSIEKITGITSPPPHEFFTTPSVVTELRDLATKARFDLLKESGLVVMEPNRESLSRVTQMAGAIGETESLSSTDTEVIALALQIGAGIASDDYALQHVAVALGVSLIRLKQTGSKNIKWKYRCSGCGRYGTKAGDCQVCGARFRRTLK